VQIQHYKERVGGEGGGRRGYYDADGRNYTSVERSIIYFVLDGQQKARRATLHYAL
jgi:hypothetical protein